MTTRKDKKKNGRPTLYDEKFMCKSIVELSTATEDRNPLTFTQIAAKWNISRESLNQYRLTYKKFSDACLCARARHKSWFESQLQKGLYDSITKAETIRLNTNAAKLYAFMCFGVTDKREPAIEFPKEYVKATFERRAEILIEMLSDKKISVSQYKTLDEVLSAQYQRSCGTKILEAEEALKLAEKQEHE